MIEKLKQIHAWAHRQTIYLRGYMKSNVLCLDNTNAFTKPVDFVVTWVDGNDPNWNEEKIKYDVSFTKGNTSARYREWNQFMYWFRAVEKYAPWVNKIYLITYGHLPSWLNINHPKLVIVNHKDYISNRYLPTFSSIPIELNIHRIPGLSEHFVYFNDDMYLSSPVAPDDFFQDELPKYCGIAYPIHNYRYNGPFVHQQLSCLGMINDVFDVYQAIEKNPTLWFNKVYGKDVFYNRLAYRESYINGMFFSHVGCPYRKSTFYKVWDVFKDELDETCSHRFRTPLDIFHQLVSVYEIMSGNFVPVSSSYYGVVFGSLSTQINVIREAFHNKKYKMVCLNDSIDVTEDNFEKIKSELDGILLDVFPEKSEFEI